MTKRTGNYYRGPRPEMSGASSPNYRHGHSHSPGLGQSPTYRSWYSMLRRCDPSRCPRLSVKNYAGISVCERWSDFINFLEDMGERPDGKTLDRIDSKGNYEPSNCRWATTFEQARNMKSNKLTYSKAVDAALLCLGGMSRAAVSRIYGCRPENISHVMVGRTWADALLKASILHSEGNG